MQGAQWAALVSEHTLKVHQATQIIRNQYLRPGLRDRLAFDLAHRLGNMREFDGEGPAKPTAGLRLPHLDQFQAADASQ